MVQQVSSFQMLFDPRRSAPAAPAADSSFAEVANEVAPASAPPPPRSTPQTPASASEQVKLPGWSGPWDESNWVVRQIRAQQLWADEYNVNLQQEYEQRLHVWQEMSKIDPKMAGDKPAEPIFQITDPLAIAAEKARLAPLPAGPEFYAQQLMQAGGTGYTPRTSGTGGYHDWYIQEHNYYGDRSKPAPVPLTAS